MDKHRQDEGGGWGKVLRDAFDYPWVWFAFVLLFGGLIVGESSNEVASILVLMFAVIVWEYERYKKGR